MDLYVSEFCWGCHNSADSVLFLAVVVFFRGRGVCSVFPVRETSFIPPPEEKVGSVLVV